MSGNAPVSARKPIQSMTGFSLVEGEVGALKLRIEMKTLNHRYLDLKLRLPRELQSSEMQFRSALAAGLSRGAVEVRVERIHDSASMASVPQLNLTLAAHYYESMITLQKTLGLNDSIGSMELATLPDVISRTSEEATIEDAWTMIEPLAHAAIRKLVEMRSHEGSQLGVILRAALDELDSKLDQIRSRRIEWETLSRKRTRERVTAIFEAHPIENVGVQAALESRIAQELALLLDRSDIEEELVRFKGHLDHFRKTLDAGGPVGRKLEFILQELNREINTLSNKALDLQISEEAVQMKVRIEQVREQVLNLE